jgi:hypothetical protein
MQALQPRFKGMDPALFRAAFEEQAHLSPKSARADEKAFANAQTFTLEAGLLKPSEALKSFKPLYTNAYFD